MVDLIHAFCCCIWIYGVLGVPVDPALSSNFVSDLGRTFWDCGCLSFSAKSSSFFEELDALFMGLLKWQFCFRGLLLLGTFLQSDNDVQGQILLLPWTASVATGHVISSLVHGSVMAFCFILGNRSSCLSLWDFN
ncbi:hypothetical protein MA16_Dca025284 [Dendrobium catenatum]|uniref:Uncharacterized protein n=1 Tax=Dendrobium catenatum TaxID=906689 RepID=A0A2I0WNA2_9ASPA|nr:hypothetical protein MA16_Dca025284 [Dendrobium catenatum]